MSERPTESQSEPIKVEVGQVFKPFEDIEEFDSADLEEPWTRVLEVPIEFQGIQGKVVVYGHLNANDINLPRVFPLGTPKIVQEITEQGVNVEKVPLFLLVELKLTSVSEQVMMLANYHIGVDFGDGSKYHLDPFGSPTMVEIQHQQDQRGFAEINSSELKDATGEDCIALLPFDLEKLKQIKMRFGRNVELMMQTLPEANHPFRQTN